MAEAAGKPSLRDRLLGRATIGKTVFSCGDSYIDALRLFYLGAVKPGLVHRGIAKHRSENLLRFRIRAAERKLLVTLRDNGLDIATFLEFFAPRPPMFPDPLPQIQPAVIYDIGANVGISALFFMCRYPGARILTFEPVPANNKVCSLNVTNSPGATSYAFAVGAKSGHSVFEFDTADLRGGSLGKLPRQACGAVERIEVPVFSIADLIAKQACPAPDFLKIDVEGAEMAVLLGMGEAVEHARTILVETHGRELEDCVRGWLEEHGFGVRHSYEAVPGFCTIWADRLNSDPRGKD